MFKRLERAMEQQKDKYTETELQTQECDRWREQEVVEYPIYHPPQLFVIDTAVRLMKNDASGHHADGSGGWYIYA
ncbi:MAG TPA: hypothetical protein VFU49_20065 [Ktedonobacteraceae bacterium]|nr:hypothetical protein [Ktedonobacteraceae bacterium]